MSAHPADLHMPFYVQVTTLRKLEEDAKKRDDLRGADAWRLARQAVELAEEVAKHARTVQDWSKRQP